MYPLDGAQHIHRAGEFPPAPAGPFGQPAGQGLDAGDQLGEGKKSLAFSVVFRSADKTFDSQDSVTVRKAVTDAAAELGAQLRA